MARIRTSHVGERTRVSISGRLGAGDMGRLEHACAVALTSERLRLEIDLNQVTGTDATATAILARLNERGAIIHPAKAPRRDPPGAAPATPSSAE